MIAPDLSLEVPRELGPVHFIGIGGSGMSGIAHMMLDAGLTVTGSDRSDSAYLDRLRDRGARIAVGHDAANLPDDARTIVYTSALWPDNPEYLLARDRGLVLLHRSQALHWLSRDHRVVTVAGAHGKTTSTGMVVTMLRELGADPGFVNGGVIQSLGTSSATGSGELFVLEADESDGSFLLYDTDIALITNVDAAHLDHYGSEDGVIAAFGRFARGAGEVVVAGEGSAVDAALALAPNTRVVRFGEGEHADLRVSGIVAGAEVTFDVTWEGRTLPARIGTPGRHHALNAAGAIAVGLQLGYPLEDAIAAVGAFGGTKRRFEFKGEVRGVRVFDDYAHEPAEVAAAVAGARSVAAGGRVIAVHQPHLYSRTRMFAREFARAYEEGADFTIVVAIDGAREDPVEGVDGQLVVDGFVDPSKVVRIDDWQEASDFLADMAREGDIVMTLSCGTVYQMVPQILDALERIPHSAGTGGE
ncbi:MAG: UDP-N-acetylmuramate--L-alanine ligase [Microbacteriaceae bacterium]|nr:UDP-N-acetylmuramate--L-alanine ligase [Microbacteriaceae bacterium]